MMALRTELLNYLLKTTPEEIAVYQDEVVIPAADLQHYGMTKPDATQYFLLALTKLLKTIHRQRSCEIFWPHNI